MIKVYVCLLFFIGQGSGGSYSSTIATVSDIVKVEDCHRVGKVWKEAGLQNQYRCIQIWKNK